MKSIVSNYQPGFLLLFVLISYEVIQPVSSGFLDTLFGDGKKNDKKNGNNNNGGGTDPDKPMSEDKGLVSLWVWG